MQRSLVRARRSLLLALLVLLVLLVLAIYPLVQPWLAQRSAPGAA